MADNRYEAAEYYLVSHRFSDRAHRAFNKVSIEITNFARTSPPLHPPTRNFPRSNISVFNRYFYPATFSLVSKLIPMKLYYSLSRRYDNSSQLILHTFARNVHRANIKRSTMFFRLGRINILDKGY